MSFITIAVSVAMIIIIGFTVVIIVTVTGNVEVMLQAVILQLASGLSVKRNRKFGIAGH
jgi:hypothetical protein